MSDFGAVTSLGIVALTAVALSRIGVIDPASDNPVADLEHSADDVDTLARTIWGEARGEGYQGMVAVANVVINRHRISRRTPDQKDWWGETIKEICLAPRQFSAWWDHNRPKMLEADARTPQFSTAMSIAARAVSNQLVDITGGATHYHATSLARYPTWTDGAVQTAGVGGHVFYREVM